VGVNKPREQNLALAINNVCTLRVRFPGCALADDSDSRGQQGPAVSVQLTVKVGHVVDQFWLQAKTPYF
jgi:hypothetical protein